MANIIGLSDILESLDISTQQLEVVGHLKQSVCLLDKKIRKLNVILSVKEQVVPEHENVYFYKLLKDVNDCLDGSLKKKSIEVYGNRTS
ncbi:hypothetical protein [Pedobacter sp. JCM 36344]|uniref:hypothetical protein n=1 Tax=Pedobacter sp. JCM 36344 TaxID=3374280 RepID=UPI00397BC549